MPKLLNDNKRFMIHLGCEVVALIGVTFYFTQKNKKLLAHIEDLAQRVEEQEDLLQKHDQIIQKLVEYVNRHQAISRPSQRDKNLAARSSRSGSVPRPRTRSVPDLSNKPRDSKAKVSFAPLPQRKTALIKEEDSSEDEISDTELTEELKDLVEESHSSAAGSVSQLLSPSQIEVQLPESNLKKRQ